MNLADLEAFVAVAEAGSVNRAALRLRLTQPAVTRRVQNFEATLGGAVLLDRRSKPPVLTPAGRQALEYCRRVLAAVDELEGSVGETKAPAGELRVGIAHGLAEIVVSAPLDALRRRFPDLRLRVSCDWTRPLADELRRGGLDCAVVLMTEYQAIPSGVTAATLGMDRLAVVAAKSLKLPRRERRLRLRDLEGQGWILNTVGCGFREALQRGFDRAGAVLRIAGEIIGYDLQMSLIARGAGIGLIPMGRLKASPLRRRLRVLDVDDFTLETKTVILRGGAPGHLRVAIDHLQANLCLGA